MINYGPTQPRIWKENKSLSEAWMSKEKSKEQEHSKGEKKREGDYFIKM